MTSYKLKREAGGGGGGCFEAPGGTLYKVQLNFIDTVNYVVIVFR